MSLFELEEYQESLETLQNNLDLAKNDDQTLVIFKDLILKNKNYIQNTRGFYDSSDFYNSLIDPEKNNFANYISDKIEIKHSKLKGKGIFAKEDIHPGELIIVERAFYSTNSNYSGDNMISIIFQLLKNDVIAQTRLNLLMEPNLTDINTFKAGLFIREKIGERKVNLEKVRNQVQPFLESRAFYSTYSFNLFLLCSLFNNGCSPTNNVEYVEIEGKRTDVLIVQSKRLIKKNEELLINYEIGITTYKDRKYQFNRWGFDCKCNYCLVDKEMNFGEIINNLVIKCNELIIENKIEAGIAAIDDLLNYISKIDKDLIISEIYNTVTPILNYFEKHEIESKRRSFLLDFLNYNDRGFFYQKILKFHAPLIIEEEILKKYQSNCCKLARDIIDKENFN